MPTETPTEAPKEFKFNLGADPEFLLFYGKRRAPANRILQSYLSKANLTQREGQMGFDIGELGELGWDGHGATAEIRPKPSKSPEELADKIGGLYSKVHEVLPFIDSTTLSIGETAGGHVHLEIPRTQAQEYLSNKKLQQQTARMIASFVIPIMASEHRLCAASRYTSSYGKAADIKIESIDGGKATCEIRGPSSEWTVNKKIATATLSYLGVIWHEMLKRQSELTKEPILFRNKTQVGAIQEMLLSDFRPVVDTIVNGIGDLVKTFELYPKFKKEVDLILNTKKARKIKEETGWNIGKGWGFQPMNKVTKKELLGTRLINKKLKEINYEELRGDFSLTYNDDFNVNLFTSSISERIATLGWTLNNEYFFFGLKKGIEGYAIANVGNDLYYEIPTNKKKEGIKDTLERMRKRFMEHRGTSVRIDPKTGKTVGGRRECILVGIPYDVRAEKNTKKFISKIWDIEQEKLKPVPFEELAEFSGKEEPEETSPENDPDLQNNLENVPALDESNIVRNIWQPESAEETVECINNLNS